MSASFRVISIGTLSAHPLWNERGDARVGHATTVLIESEGARIIVDPGLPASVLQQRLDERTNYKPDDITHVFLTSFDQEHRRGLLLFEKATWMLFEREREATEAILNDERERARDVGDQNLLKVIGDELDLLSRCKDAPDSIAPGVDLFPLPGVTPGTCGLLLPQPSRTVLLCSDAIATMEHLEQGQVLTRCADHEMAQESFREAVEIADVFILGRDNVSVNPVRRMMGQ